MEAVIPSVSAVPAGGVETAIGEVSVASQDDLDVPLSKLVPLPERPHEGEGDPPTAKGKTTTGQTPGAVDSMVHKTPSPRFSSFLTECRENPEVQAASPLGGKSECLLSCFCSVFFSLDL